MVCKVEVAGTDTSGVEASIFVEQLVEGAMQDAISEIRTSSSCESEEEWHASLDEIVDDLDAAATYLSSADYPAFTLPDQVKMLRDVILASLPTPSNEEPRVQPSEVRHALESLSEAWQARANKQTGGCNVAEALFCDYFGGARQVVKIARAFSSQGMKDQTSDVLFTGAADRINSTNAAMVGIVFVIPTGIMLRQTLLALPPSNPVASCCLAIAP